MHRFGKLEWFRESIYVDRSHDGCKGAYYEWMELAFEEGRSMGGSRLAKEGRYRTLTCVPQTPGLVISTRSTNG